MSQRLRFSQIVDRDEFEIVMFQGRAHDVAADAPKPLMPTLVAMFPP